LDLRLLETFLDRCKTIGLGEAKRGVITMMPAKPIQIRDKKHRWGGCLTSFTFRGGNRYEQPTLSMHSRVTYIGYMGGCDLALAYVLAREIGRKIGKKPSEFAFRWHLGSSQIHFFKTLPYLFHTERGLIEALTNEREFPSDKYPTLKGARKWYGGILQSYEDGKPLEAEKYGPLKRIRRRYQEYLQDPGHTLGISPPRIPIKELSFDPLRQRG
jgi:hypothetical protein